MSNLGSLSADVSKSTLRARSSVGSPPVSNKLRVVPKIDSHNNIVPDYGSGKKQWNIGHESGSSLPANQSQFTIRKENFQKTPVAPMVAKPKSNYMPAGLSDSDSDEFEFSSGPSFSKSDVRPSLKVVTSSTTSNANSFANKIRRNTKILNFPSIPYVNGELSQEISGELNSIWNSKKGSELDAAVSILLRNSFADAINPYSLGLYLGLHSNDFRLHKNASLAFTVFNQLKQWLTVRGMREMELKFLSPPLQIVAFKVITLQKNSALLRLVSTIYRLDLIRDQLVAPIKELAADGNFKEACISATILRLYKSFTIHEFLIPLVLQEQMNIVEEFMIGSDDIQKSLLSYLDDLLLKENMGSFLRDYVAERKINQFNKSRFEPRAMTKLIQKLSEKFKLSQNICPNSGRRRKTGSIRHLLSRRYGEASFMHDNDFEDLIDEITADDTVLQDETVFLLRIYGDITAAAKFAMRKAMQFKSVPDDVQQEMRRLNPMVCPTESEGKVAACEEEDWDTVSVMTMTIPNSPNSPSGIQSPNVQKKIVTTAAIEETLLASNSVASTQDKEEISSGPSRVQKRSRASQKFYTIQLPSNRIHVVENPQGVQLFLKHISAGQIHLEKSAKKELFTVGFDAEWKPMNPSIEGVSIIQVATPEAVFLIDCMKLKSLDMESQTIIWNSLLKEFFANDKVNKLGYGISQDFKQLAATTPHWKNIGSMFRNTIDLQKVSTELQRVTPKFFPHNTDAPSEFKGLAELVRLCTGTPLNKDEQWSNWEKRPLRETQLMYAATDAVCLLDIFDFIKVRCREKNIDFDKLIYGSGCKVATSSALKKGRNRSAVELVKNITNLARHNSNSPFKSVQPVSQVKLIVDNMLTALGKQLRACGIDTLILDERESHTKCALHAVRDDRYIVTQGPVFHQLAAYVPDGHCYQVQSTAIMMQLKDVLIHFNICVSDTDIFSRCQRCNCRCFINVKGCNMRNIVLHSNARLDAENPDKGVIGGLQMRSGTLHEDMIPATLTQDKKAHKAWKLLPETDLRHPDPSVVKTKSGATVELHRVPVSLLDSIDDFYICDNCGKCYWEGIHLERILTVSADPSTESLVNC